MIELSVAHPLVSHFPITLLFATPFSLVVWSHLQSPHWHAGGFIMALTGAIGATLACLTGPAMIPHAKNPDIQALVLTSHQTVAWLTFALAWITVGLLVLAYRQSDYVSEIPDYQRLPYWTRFWCVSAAALCGACAAYTAHTGAQMVWGQLALVAG